MPATAVGLLFIAFLAKLSAYWALPLWVWALITDLKGNDWNKLLRKFWLPVLAIGLLLGAAYLAASNVIWGDPIARLKSIQALTGEHLWAWDKASDWEFIKRLTISPVRLFANQYGFAILFFSLLGVVVTPRTMQPWGIYAFSCVLLFWFGSTSFSSYEPMPLMPRMILPALPAFYILAGFTLSRTSLTLKHYPWVRSCFPVLLVLGLSGWPFLQYVASWHWKIPAEMNAMSMLKAEIEKNPGIKYLLICSDQRSPGSLSFYFGYKYPENLEVTFAGDLSNKMLHGQKTYIYLNKHRSQFLQSSYGRRNFDNELEDLKASIIHSSEGISLFEIKQDDGLRAILNMWENRNSGGSHSSVPANL